MIMKMICSVKFYEMYNVIPKVKNIWSYKKIQFSNTNFPHVNTLKWVLWWWTCLRDFPAKITLAFHHHSHHLITNNQTGSKWKISKLVHRSINRKKNKSSITLTTQLKQRTKMQSFLVQQFSNTSKKKKPI